MKKLIDYLNDQDVRFDDFIQELDFGSWISIIIAIVIRLSFLILILYILSFTFKRIIQVISKYIIKSTPYSWDKILYKKKVFDSLAYFFPLLFTSSITEFLFSSYPWIISILEKIFSAIFILVLLQFLIRIINSITHIATDENNHRTVAIHTFSQLLKIFFVVFCILIIISILYNIELTAILTSLGTLTAVIVLVFRDTILGFVSGMQIASTKMIKVGDWISIPKHFIEGNVIEFSLFSAKIENFDRTISTVPTYDLITTAVINFENMRKKNIRRIKYAIIFNIKSFNFCELENLYKFKKFNIIKNYINEYIKNMKILLKEDQNIYNIINNNKINTNISIFRKYIITYLKNNPYISQNESIMVRYLKITPYGLPLEIYCFTSTSEWIHYETIQADILDHLITISKYFNLEVVQTNVK